MSDVSTAPVKSGKLPTFAEIQAALRGRKLDPLGAIADKLDVPLWVMFVPGLSKEFFAEKRQLHLVHVVNQYVAGDDEPARIAQIDSANDDARLALDALRQVIQDLPDSSSHGPTLLLISERLEKSWDQIEDLCGEAP